MTYRIGLSIITCIMASCSHALVFAFTSMTSHIPSANQEGIFIGMGGGYNSIKVDSRHTGTLNAISGFPPNGIFTGIPHSHDHTRYLLSPELQAGLFQKLNNSEWMWGFKLLYQYLQANNNEKQAYVDYINSSNTIDKVSGQVKTRIGHEFAALVQFGHSYTNGMVYMGVGPALLGTKNHIDTIADNDSGYYIGNLDDFPRQTKRAWGFMAQVGANYYLNPTLFLDLSYFYTLSSRLSINSRGTFTPDISGGLNTGIISFDTSKRVTLQSVILTLNKILPC